MRTWPTPDQVEPDLLLSRVLIAIYQDEVLSEELVLRGGTCLHKLYLPAPRRYSEDLDFVRRRPAPFSRSLNDSPFWVSHWGSGSAPGCRLSRRPISAPCLSRAAR